MRRHSPKRGPIIASLVAACVLLLLALAARPPPPLRRGIVVDTPSVAINNRLYQNEASQGTQQKGAGIALAEGVTRALLKGGVGMPKNGAEAIQRTVEGTGDALTFLTVGDWGGNNEDSVRVANAMAKVAANSNPRIRFIMSVGDNFYPDGVMNLEDPQFKESFEDVFNQKELVGIPWYIALGQHDLRRNASAQVAYTGRSHRWYLPARYYTSPQMWVSRNRDVSLQLFVLDSYAPNLVSDQVPFLERALANSTANWRLVVGHQPIYTSTGVNRHGDAVHGTDKTLVQYLAPLFKHYRVQGFFCGDNHFMEVLQANGTVHVLSGGGMGSDHPIYAGKKDEPRSLYINSTAGFTFHRVERDRMMTQVYDSYGNVIFEHMQPRVQPAP